MVLKTLDAMGPQHGYGIARRIEQMAEGMLALNQGTIYPALLRLEQKGWIESDWGTSENNRRARFYSITRAGRKQLALEADLWSRTVAMMSRMLGALVVTLRSALKRIQASFTRRSLDASLDEEVRSHLEMLAADHQCRGLTPEAAGLAARRDFGGIEQIKDAYRDARGVSAIEHIWRDLAYAG